MLGIYEHPRVADGAKERQQRAPQSRVGGGPAFSFARELVEGETERRERLCGNQPAREGREIFISTQASAIATHCSLRI